MLLLCALVVGSGTMWGQTTTTYTFTGKSWTATSGGSAANWTSGQDGSGFSNNGIQVTTNSTGANGTSPISFTNVTQIVATYNTNASKGAGTIEAKIGNNASVSKDWAYSTGTGTSANYTVQWDYNTPQTGNVKITCNTTTNSIYLVSVAITTAPSQSITAVSNNNDWGTVSGTTTITASPNAGYRVVAGDGGYTVTSGTATVVNNGDNTFTVTPTTDCTVRINFEAIPIFTVSFNAEGGSCNTSSLTESIGGGGVTLPTATTSVAGWEFVGWAEDEVTNTSTMPSMYKAGSTYHPTSATTLHAVYTLSEAGTTYTRVTSASQISFAKKIAVASSKSTSRILNHDATTVTAPTETTGEITVSTDQMFALSGDNTAGYVLTGASGTLSQETLSSSGSGNNDKPIDWSGTNNKWIIEVNTSADNLFALRNANSSQVALEFDSGWKTYYVGTYTSSQYTAMKLYIPKTAYNSNPSAITVSTVAFGSNDPVTLYLDGTKTHTNTATKSDSNMPITYSSSNTSVATVNGSGVVTAVGIGTATITASVDAELGVSTSAFDTYEVTVKNTTNIAGLKALYDAAQNPAKEFAADLTDAIVTYVSGNHAYIQDATGAIYASCGSSLAAGKKINGAVSGTITAPNQIDEIKTIDLSKATLTDTDVPAAAVKTLAEIKAGDYDGKLVTVNGATIKTGMNDATSGGVITDDNNETTFNIIAPNNLTLIATEKGNFTGFVSIYGGSTYRLNLYNQDQFTKTHNAPAAQTLTFASNAVELDEETDAYASFTGQTVSGNQGAITYSVDSDDDDVVTSINASTGAVVLSGNYGTATIKATAAYAEVDGGNGYLTPYPAADKTYTITVNPRYTITFSVLGNDVEKREATSGAGVTAPEVETMGINVFLGWTNDAIGTPTDTKPKTVITSNTFTGLTGNVTYYALFGQETVGEDEEVTSTFTVKQSSTPTNPYVNNGASWTFGGDITHSTGGMASSAYATCTLPSNAKKAVSITITTSNTWGKNAKLELSGNDNVLIETLTKDNLSYEFTSSNNEKAPYTVSSTGTQTAWVNSIAFVYTIPGIDYNQYTTSPADKTNIIVEDAEGNKSAESIDLATVTDVNALAGVHADEITYTRTMGKLSTLYLPYASTVPSGMKAYKFKNAAGSVLKFEEVDAIEANKPYVLEQDASASKEFSATDVTIDIDNTGKFDDTNWELRGTLEQISNEALLAEAGSGNAYIAQSDGKWHVVTNNGVKVPAFRAYFITSESTEAKIMEMNLGGTTTSISALDNLTDSQLDDDAPIYNLAGQKVTKAYKGVVIQNGKKMLNK